MSAKTSDSSEDNTPGDPPAAPPSGSHSFKSRNPEVDFHGRPERFVPAHDFVELRSSEFTGAPRSGA